MKYESPELVVLTLAINAIEGPGSKQITASPGEGTQVLGHNEHVASYADWE